MRRDECVTLGGSATVRTCTFGEPTAAINVVLFGDSHAIQWFDALKEIAQARGWRLTTMLKSGCPADGSAIPGGTTMLAAVNSGEIRRCVRLWHCVRRSS